jgi:hypothetical protein
MPSVTEETNDWLTRQECLRLLECTQPSFTEIVSRGLVRRRDVPGHRKYWREDVERLASPPDAA